MDHDPFEDFFSVIKDKRISPWFWIFTILYIGLLLYLVLMPDSSGFAGRGAVLLVFFLLLPYFIISAVYITHALGKKHKRMKK